MSSSRPHGQSTRGHAPKRGGPGFGFRGGRSGRPATRGGGPSGDFKATCRFFLQGHCRDGTTCRYAHAQPQPGTPQANPGGPPRNRPNAPSQPPAPPPSNFPGLTNDQFSTGGNTAPAKTRQGLKQYVADNFKFSIPEQVYKFVELLCNASSQNASWTPVDGQTHLRDLVKGNGILRLEEALRFPAETSRPWSFQRGYIPIFTYLSSEWVTKSLMNSDVNALYGLVHNQLGVIRKMLDTHMKRLMEARSFKEGATALSGKQVFKVLFVTMFEYLTRFKQATTTNPEVCDLVEQIAKWFEDWVVGLQSNPPFDDECVRYEVSRRDQIINNLRHNKDQVLHIVRRTTVKVTKPEEQLVRRGPIAEGLSARLHGNFKYDRPGANRESGPRHDNDHELIDRIRVAPTHAELLCEFEPFLPGNFLEAPHFYEAGSVERLLDIQFRLLREELTAPIRTAVQEVVSDLVAPHFGSTSLSKLIGNGGGRYPNNSNAQDSVLFSVFTNVAFQPLSVSNRGTSVGLTFDAPPGQARRGNPRERKDYWERVTKKHLMQDTLVALIWKDLEGVLDIYIGKVASTPEDLIGSAMRSPDRVTLKVSFLDAAPELRILHILQHRITEYGTAVLIEAPVLFESIRPFLEALKRDPETLPFAQYLRLQPKEELSQTAIAPPLYSLSPGFSFQLKDLFDTSANVPSLRLIANNPNSIATARVQLASTSRLDPSQADAVISSLTQEIALIQGPPGTGKSYTGLELIRVLLKNDISPILLVAFTNHALDHMLNGVLKNKITEKIIRVGSRFRMDENLARFALEDLVRAQPKSGLDREVGTAFRAMKTAETEIVELMKLIASRQIPPEHVFSYLMSTFPSHYKEFSRDLPAWIQAVSRQHGLGNRDTRDADQGWQKTKKTKNYSSIIEFWAAGEDLKFLDPQEDGKNTTKKVKKEQIASLNMYSILEPEITEGMDDSSSDHESVDSEPIIDPRQEILLLLRQHGLEEIPPIPNSSRQLEVLRTDSKVWNMSLGERRTLHNVWITAASESLRKRQVEDFERLRQAHSRARTNFEERKDQARANVLKCAHIIGCTTTGAAKIISLLSSVEPKVMIVEEAGQVLESHILGSLVESVQQVIMIGDPLQLRPNVNSYKLSMDNPNTGKIYRFDQSLMERLSTSGFPMSQLAVQRRMRPEISSLIRNTLYPELKDNELVFKYPHVRGMSKDVYFISHTYKESGGGDESVSKHNQYEVDMIHDLVIHLLKQGCYNEEGDIVILAAYLGQIPKIRQKLRGVVETLVDERDADLLEQRGIEDAEGKVKKVDLSQQVIIRTLDNFQGEEGKVILLSLVRNSGTPFDGTVEGLQYGGKAPIGFLKSNNRTNVGLSRAKHGLYIFGNAPELARGSQMWASVLREMHTSEAGGIGQGFRISCQKHPDYEQWVDRPGALKQVSPEGGCRRDCLANLPCSHLCPLKCHSNDPQHITTQCNEPCLRLCPVQHPCDRRCWECAETLADCRFPVHNIPLPCGHVHPSAPCYLAQLPEKIICHVHVQNIPLPCGHVHPSAPCHLARFPETIQCNVQIRNLTLSCGHVLASTPCHIARNPESIQCQVQVSRQLPTCEHSATMPCHQDLATYYCRQMCRVNRSCCSTPCVSECGGCKTLNPPKARTGAPPDNAPLLTLIARTKHTSHPCGKALRCGHACKGECKGGHLCLDACGDKCQQACTHKSCDRSCSTPCGPCVLPCDWKCSHAQCPDACNIACTRLPCDKKCTTVLTCGHPCPSVCGEPCNQQICPACAKHEPLDGIAQRIRNTHLHDTDSEDNKNSQGMGPSTILGSTLGRFRPNEPQYLPAAAVVTVPDLRSMTITLACKHVFPVATLDRITELHEFYEKDRNGYWSKPTTPSASRHNHSLPVCPTCGRGIDSLRYGRIYKSFHFTTSQQNIVRSLSGMLNGVVPGLTAVREDIEDVIFKVIGDSLSANTSITLTDDTRRKISSKIQRRIRKNESTPVALLSDLRNLRAFSKHDDEASKKAAAKAFGAYQLARKFTSHHDPTIQTYQKSLTRLFQGEMAQASLGRSRSTLEGSKQAALRVARLQVGHLPPRAGLRYIVEAYWITVEILVLLGRSTSKAVSQIQARKSNPGGFENWGNLAEFFLSRAIADTETACKIAVLSESWNKVVKCEALLLFLRFELATHHCRMAFAKSTPSRLGERAELVDKCSQGMEQLKTAQTSIPSEYLRRCGLNGLDFQTGQKWVHWKFIQPSTVLLGSWEALRKTASGGFFHEEPANERAFELLNAMFKEMEDQRSKVGRVSQCQNGHPNVLEGTDVRMGGSACMECGVITEG